MNSEFLEKYVAALHGDETQNKKYAKYVADFLRENGNRAIDREAVERRIKRLADAKYAGATINGHFRILRAAFRVNGIEWPFRRGEGPVVREHEVLALALDDKLVRRMVLAARRDVALPPRQRRLMPYDALYLALGTTYAARCSELAALSKKTIDAERNILYVETKKSGRERFHVIPEQIRSYVYGALPSLAPKTPQCLNTVFRRCERLAGLAHTDELAWHGFRRMLDRRLLQSGLESQAVSNFLRWKRSSSVMVDRYHSNITVVGEAEDGVAENGSGDAEVDLRVYEHHPFLPFWEEEL